MAPCKWKEITKNSASKKAEKHICQQCGLVTEQHPLLQRLKQCSDAVFGDARELVSERERNKLERNTYALCLQRALVILRIVCKNNPADIGSIVKAFPTSTYGRELETLWHYIIQYHNIFPVESVTHGFLDEFSVFDVASRHLQENGRFPVDPRLIIYSWHQLVRYGASNRELSPLHRLDTTYRRTDIIILKFVEYIRLILTYYIVGLPARLSMISLDNINVRQFIESFKLTGITNTSTGRDKAGVKLISLSPELVYMFFIQVHGVVRSNLKSSEGHTLLYYACKEFISKDIDIYIVEVLLRIGADPNYVDNRGETLVGSIRNIISQNYRKVTRLLVLLIERGAHFDAFKRQGDSEEDGGWWFHFLRINGVCPVRYGKLTCLVANAIRRNAIDLQNPTIRSLLTMEMGTFLNMH